MYLGVFVDDSKWTVFWSNEPGKEGDIGEYATNTAFAKTWIIKRECSNCDLDHGLIYYKRLTPIPPGVSIYQLMTRSWTSNGNILGTDFQLYSSMYDLQNNINPWKYCNYDDPNVGAFRDCGKTGYVADQWTSQVYDFTRQATYFTMNPLGTLYMII